MVSACALQGPQEAAPDATGRADEAVHGGHHAADPSHVARAALKTYPLIIGGRTEIPAAGPAAAAAAAAGAPSTSTSAPVVAGGGAPTTAAVEGPRTIAAAIAAVVASPRMPDVPAPDDGAATAAAGLEAAAARVQPVLQLCIDPTPAATESLANGVGLASGTEQQLSSPPVELAR